MSYAVVQTELTAPTEEQLVQAFEATSSLRAVDAKRLARHQSGIIAEGLSEEDARALQRALTGLGTPAEAIDQADLPLLPLPKSMISISCRTTALEVRDGMSRSQVVDWDDVLLIAVGDVGYVKEVVTRTPGTPNINLALAHGGLLPLAVPTPPDTERREVPKSQLLLEIHTDSESCRYQARLPGIIFTYLGDRLSSDRMANVRMLLGDLLRLAPHALINRGASMLTQDPPQTLSSNTRLAFEKELRWLRWWGQRPA